MGALPPRDTRQHEPSRFERYAGPAIPNTGDALPLRIEAYADLLERRSSAAAPERKAHPSRPLGQVGGLGQLTGASALGADVSGWITGVLVAGVLDTVAVIAATKQLLEVERGWRAPPTSPAPRRDLHRADRDLPPAHRANQAQTDIDAPLDLPLPKKIIEITVTGR